jgi:hypothetical protein
LYPGRCVENLIEASILARAIREERPHGVVVDLGGGVFAVTRRNARSPLGTRKVWRVTRLVVQDPRGAPGSRPAAHPSLSAGAATLTGEPSLPTVARTAPGREVMPRDAG